ncbi:DNA-binding proteins Bright/BRCAA1/RBP1 and proteins containing BRIGHT domain [Emydomyces testavorans]|uniref:DNA-binding proteins Bright/BRCAA1/RBP1 and proteins containing BRIGHT domain n=1 Tax=Emydomyces testavorans TaxID=2070801 RepID=A0AAF0DBB1_9EURO|nr:DNA-binding proteins Bright/BRCAA1/RBP1 and proteins containing BRIGHT domain [Emydomyces testavorans]
MATRPATSSIAMALAGKTPSVEIPKSRDFFRTYPGNAGFGHQPGQPAMLPTPPSSISPSLPPQGFKHRMIKTPDSPPLIPEHVDSDIDLHDAVDPPKTRNKLVPEALNSLDSTEAITPTMLAKHHLPNILLDQGPLAIRHIMGYLTTSVPGFSSIPPAKARRLVVGALEGKGGNGEAGGVQSDVEFEKVGWGRWDAKRRGQPVANSRTISASTRCSQTLSHTREKSCRSADLPIKEEYDQYGSSFAGESVVFSHSEWDYGDRNVLEHEADKMSLDGDDRAYCSSTQASDDDSLMNGDWGEADVTDEEDWAQIGAAALRARFLPNGSEGDRSYLSMRSKGGSGGGPAWSTLTKSVPGPIPIQNIDFPCSDGVGGNFEERAAVEALLQLGSM